MRTDLRRRIELLERIRPIVGPSSDGNAWEEAFAKATAFVDANGGRQGGESWAVAMARIMGLTTAELMSNLSGAHVAAARKP